MMAGVEQQNNHKLIWASGNAAPIFNRIICKTAVVKLRVEAVLVQYDSRTEVLYPSAVIGWALRVSAGTPVGLLTGSTSVALLTYLRALSDHCSF